MTSRSSTLNSLIRIRSSDGMPLLQMFNLSNEGLRGRRRSALEADFLAFDTRLIGSCASSIHHLPASVLSGAST
jgi:hypothetical protein